MIGCGNSNFSSDLYDDGYTNITSNDFSELVVNEMKSKRADMRWDVMDMTNMTYTAGSMDVILDKGALDALMSDETGIHPCIHTYINTYIRTYIIHPKSK